MKVYSRKWHDRLSHLANQKYLSPVEVHELSYLIGAAERIDDVRVVQVLVDALKNSGLGELSQSIYGVLSTIKIPIYYRGVFENSSKLLRANSEVAVQLLDWQMRDLTANEMDVVFRIADKILKDEDLGLYVDVMREYGYIRDYPYSNFFKYFSKRLTDGRDD